jgi:S-adenosylmethionine hydrolase
VATLVTMLTDFGTADGYAAAMKGVLLAAAPAATVVDAGHDVPPQDIQSAAWALYQYWRYYPEGTIHVAVVDPGVGTERRALLVEAEGRILLAPDNGLLTWIIQTAGRLRLHAIRPQTHRPGDVSATFHGRDVFAHVAGRLAAGAAIAELAEPLNEVTMPDWAAVEVGPSALRGRIVHVDRFGNLITSITRLHLERAGWAAMTIHVGSCAIPRISRTYGDVQPGMVVALIGSSGHLEMAIRDGSARERIGAARGDAVRVEPGHPAEE